MSNTPDDESLMMRPLQEEAEEQASPSSSATSSASRDVTSTHAMETTPIVGREKERGPGLLPVRYQLGIMMFLSMAVVCAMRQHFAVALQAMVTIPGLLPVRYQLGIMMFLAMAVVCAMRQNVAVALEAMVTTSYTSYRGSDNDTDIITCSANDDSTMDSEDSDGEFTWSTETQELILAAFYYGYIFTQAIGGWCADRFGVKWVMGTGILISSCATLVGPTAARAGSAWYFASRVIAGVGEGVTIPAMLSTWGKWAHPSERSRLSSTGYAGINVGFLLGAGISGELCTLELDGGWPLGFYLFGTCGVIWFILWCIFVYSTPEQHPHISKEEKEYLEEGLKMAAKKVEVPVPWCAILTSCDVWVLIITQMVNSWGIYVVIGNLPLYFGSGMGMSISKAGLYAALPFGLTLIVLLTGGHVADWIVARGLLEKHNTRKLMNTLGCGLYAVFFAAAGFLQCNVDGAVTCVILGIGFSGFIYSGYYVSILDVCGPFAGSVMGIMNMLGTLVGIVGPYIVGVLTEQQTDIRGWQNSLWMFSGIYLFGAVVFLVFGSSKLQSWATISENNVLNGEYQELE